MAKETKKLVQAITSPEYIKHAYNAAFEIACMSRHLGTPLPLSQWRCTMLHGLYVGYPGNLDATGKALGLEEDKRKMAAGKALIRYFCTPCKPTKANGGRTRNLPHHDPGRWDLFKEYNAQDVVTEMEIERRLSGFPVPVQVQAEWVQDQIINARGVAMDTELISGAIGCNTRVTDELTAEAREITRLQNPKSVTQLRDWLRERDIDTDTLRKEDVTDLLARDDLPPDVRRVLEIRQELGKTSVTKYQAMVAAMCSDNRIRGFHAGVSGSLLDNLDYRVLVSYRKSWGSYDAPRLEKAKDTSFMLEASYAFNQVKGLSLKGQFAMDRGNLLGDSYGVLVSLKYDGILNLFGK